MTKDDETRIPIYRVHEDNHGVLVLKQYSATAKMRARHRYDFTPEAAIATYVAGCEAEVSKIQHLIKTAKGLKL